MQKSKALVASEANKNEPFFTHAPTQPATTILHRDEQLIPIEACNDYVVIARDTLSSTIQLTGNTVLPTGIVVGIGPDSKLNVGDHVRFNDTALMAKDAIYPGYEGVTLAVLSEKYVLYKLPK